MLVIGMSETLDHSCQSAYLRFESVVFASPSESEHSHADACPRNKKDDKADEPDAIDGECLSWEEQKERSEITTAFRPLKNRKPCQTYLYASFREPFLPLFSYSTYHHQGGSLLLSAMSASQSRLHRQA